MRKLIFLLFFSILVNKTHADTTDCWKVHYNHLLVRDCGYSIYKPMIIKMDSVKRGDSISVSYYTDAPCSACISYLTIENEKHHRFITVNQNNNYQISLALSDLLIFKDKGHFEVHYFRNINSRPYKTLLFRIKLE